jgi:hypothetical protein
MFMRISGWFLLRIRIRDVPDRSVEKLKTHILCSVALSYSPHENLAVLEILWKNMLGQTSHSLWRIRFACFIPKATDTHS